MENSAAAAGFGHLLPSDTRAASLAATVVAVAAAAAALLCCLNWNSAVFAGLTAGEKVTNAVFMAVNVRQAGENSVDCSLVAPAVLVLFLAMMSVMLLRAKLKHTRQHIVRSLTDFACQPTTFRCIPASATLLSVHDDGGEKKRSGAEEPERKDGEKKRRLSLNSMLLSPLACNAAAVMLACITPGRSTTRRSCTACHGRWRSPPLPAAASSSCSQWTDPRSHKHCIHAGIHMSVSEAPESIYGL